MLLEESATKKYLLYALGEIFLVVIGILIALQINNWNEARIQQSLAEQYKIKLRQDIIADTLEINRLIALGRRMDEKINGYYRLFEEGQAPVELLIDTLNKIGFSLFRYLPTNYTFLDMQSTGNTGLLSEAQRRAMMELSQEQKFVQIVIDQNVDRWFSDFQEAKKYLDMDSSESDFYEVVGHIPDKSDLIKGLKHRHDMIESNHTINDVMRIMGDQLLEYSRNCLKTLEN